jgi:LysR family transcriptional regulator, glycine cleavage system transcriptional activator
MAPPTHLKAMQALEAAVRFGSISRGAEALGITPAAMGQRIKALEDYLGLELLTRGRAGMAPTAELAAALPHLHTAFAALEDAAGALDMQRASEIHIAAASDFVELWLEPRLPAFRAEYPGLLFCINGAGEVPVRLGRADCEIGFGAVPPAEDRLADLLFRDLVLPIGSPANVARVAPMPAVERLEGFPLLHLDFYKDDPAGLSWPEWIARNQVLRTAPDRGMRFQRITAALAAVEANAGLCLAGAALILERIDAGTIELPYPVETGKRTTHAFFARYRPDTQARRHVARFRAWLLDEARKTEDELARLIAEPR